MKLLIHITLVFIFLKALVPGVISFFEVIQKHKEVKVLVDYSPEENDENDESEKSGEKVEDVEEFYLLHQDLLLSRIDYWKKIFYLNARSRSGYFYYSEIFTPPPEA